MKTKTLWKSLESSIIFLGIIGWAITFAGIFAMAVFQVGMMYGYYAGALMFTFGLLVAVWFLEYRRLVKEGKA